MLTKFRSAVTNLRRVDALEGRAQVQQFALRLIKVCEIYGAISDSGAEAFMEIIPQMTGVVRFVRAKAGDVVVANIMSTRHSQRLVGILSECPTTMDGILTEFIKCHECLRNFANGLLRALRRRAQTSKRMGCLLTSPREEKRQKTEVA